MAKKSSRVLTGAPPIWPVMLGAAALYWGTLFLVIVLAYNWIYDLIMRVLGHEGAYVFRMVRYPVVMIVFVFWLLFVYGYAKLWQEQRYRAVLLENLMMQANVILREDDSQVKLGVEMQDLEQKLNTLKLTNINNIQAAKLAEQRKNDLVVYLAHDIKTPLTSVIGYLSLLDEVEDMPAEQRRKYTKVTLEKAYRLEHLINEFFDITRFNLQTIVLERREVKLDHMLYQMADEFYPILTPQNKQARVEVPEELTVYADPDKLARVLNNMLKNAVSYSYPNTEILIRAENRGRWTVVDVCNRGPTIPQERLDTIFEKFFRLDSARSSESGGAGLGLAIAKEIVEVHGGNIKVRSADEQTIFRVELPRHNAKPRELPDGQ